MGRDGAKAKPELSGRVRMLSKQKENVDMMQKFQRCVLVKKREIPETIHS